MKIVMLTLPLLLGLAACQTAPRPPAQDAAAARACLYVEEQFGEAGTTRLQAEVVANGLEVPWGIAFLPDQSMLVTERAGRVRLIRSGQLLAQPLLTLPVDQNAESGLLGIALHPQFATNRLLYLYYTVEKEGEAINRVERYRVAADLGSASRDRIILDDIPAARFHSGGRLRFGPDGMLYVGTGDAREPALAQQRESMAGKILRVDAEGGIPADNPWTGLPAFVMGIRNTQGFDWLDSGKLIVTDHGPSGEMGRTGGDEVTLASKGSNLGWPTIWGCEEQDGLVRPLLVWKTAAPPGGAAIYRGEHIPGWKGSLIIGTLGSRHLHRVVLDAAGEQVTRHEVYFEGDPPAGHGRLRDVIMGPDGHLYVTTSNCDGRGECGADKDSVLRIVGTSRVPAARRR